ncbi:ferritin-like domain-containing protein [Saccharomonospora glauca]|uniref:ferritin-like domain-containing protein n=1 Tax=Saccharomonospora glauca TaxID=40990 RepID=UPI000594009A|nr:ferritin-like domain-containing protein [Saccharomonospora glauca]
MRSQSGRPAFGRRVFLRAAAFTVLAVPTASGLAACTSGYEDAPDPLRPLWLQASGHAKAAEKLATESSDLADVAGQVATVRAAHAEALRAEVERLNRPVPEGETPPTFDTSDPSRLWSWLAEGRDEALRLLPELPRHRAGLVGSVAAGCAAALELGQPSQLGEPAFDPTSVTRLEDDTANAVQTALETEHAAIWVYGLVRAFLDEDYESGITRGERAHIERRDVCERLLSAAGRTPRPAEPAYVLTDPVTDDGSAARAVATAESDATTAWHGVLERTDDASIRDFAVHCLIGAATRGVHWREEAGIEPVVPRLPGREPATH